MNSRFKTLLAGAATLLLVGVSVSAAATASASPVQGVTVSVDIPNPTMFDSLTFTATINGGDNDCTTDPPTSIGWIRNPGDYQVTGEFDSPPVADGTALDYTYNSSPIGDGGELTFEVTATGGCLDDQEFTDSVTVSTPWIQFYAYGHTGIWNAGATSVIDYTTTPGVTVDVLDVADGPTGVPVYSTVSNSDGNYTVFAPINSLADLDKRYKIRYTFPNGGPVLYNNGLFQAPGVGSATNWDDAVEGGPGVWLNGTYNGMIGVPTPSQTDFSQSCFDGPGTVTSVHNGAITWENVCLTDPTVGDAETNDNERSNAFDGFGKIALWASPDGTDKYYVTSSDTSQNSEGTTSIFDLTDHNVSAYNNVGELVNVDVHVHREFTGSWARWAVTIDSAGTEDTLDNVPFYFLGDLGSDGDTTWHGNSSYQVSSDDSNQDPILVHLSNSNQWDHTHGNDQINFTAYSGFVYDVGVVDYSDCINSDVISGVEQVASVLDYDSTLPNLATQIGSECPARVFDIPTPSFQVGVPFDQTYTAPVNGVWDWTYGGTTEVAQLPDGLTYQILNNWQPGLPPSVRIFGTPTTAGDYSFLVYTDDSQDLSYSQTVEGTVADAEPSSPPTVPPVAPSPDANLTLSINVGEPVEGATVTGDAVGLQDGASYELELHSTPQIISSGVVPTGGHLQFSALIPAGLETGWHSLTLRSTWFDGSSLSKVLWFQVDANGNLVATSATAPASDSLAFTGSSDDAQGIVYLGATFFVIALGLLTVSRRRRKTVE